MWNLARVHIALSHFPIAAVVLGVLFLAASEITKKTWLAKAAAVLLVIAGLGAGASYLTGDGAEQALWDFNQAYDTESDSNDWVPEHEKRAQIALWFLVGSGVGGALLLYLGRKPDGPRPPIALRLLVLVTALGATAGALATASAGGEVRHPENRALVADEGEGENSVTADSSPAPMSANPAESEGSGHR
jgi:hypothetical protein